MMLRKLIAIAALISPAASFANPVPQKAQQPTLAIAGIEAYYPVTKVETVLAGAGFTRHVSTDELSFRGQVEFAVGQAQRKPRDSYSRAVGYQLWRKGGDEIAVWFLQLPEGPVVKHVLFKLPTSRQSPDQVVAELIRRFGKPNVVASNNISGKTAFWCKIKSASECDYTDTNLRMSTTGNQISLRLRIDDRREKMTEAAVQEEARKLAGGVSF